MGFVRTYVRIHLLHPPLLSSKRLGLFPSNKVRPGKKEADADPLTRNGHIPRPCRPSVAFFFPSSARHAHPLRTYVRAHSAGIFQRNARARTPFRESWREKRVSGGRSRGGGKGRERARVCVQGCIIRVQRNLSGWRGPQQDGKVVSRLWMYFISRYHVGYDFSRGIRWKWKIVRARLTSIFRYLSSGFKFILEMRWIESRNFFLFSSNFYRIALIFNIFRCKIFTYLTIFTYLIYRKKNRDNFDRI